jgi:phosphonate metabolism protein PhnN/1,5-bisphosphokinase (PRPP-forming)
MSGIWIIVCGPSGAGKDTVLAWARVQLAACANVVFAQRLITRPAHPESDHLPIEAAEFERRRKAGEFALHWQAHGFDYAIAQPYAAQVAAGCAVVVNGSRAHVDTLRAQGAPAGGSLRTVQIVAPPALLIERLAARQRESAAAVAARLARTAQLRQLAADATIVNDRSPAAAGAQLADFIRACAARSPVAAA